MHNKAHDICLVIGDLSAGGAQRVVVTLVAAWCDRGQRVAVITHSRPDNDFFALDRRVTRLVLPDTGPSSSLMQAISNNFRRLLALRRALKSTHSPIVISFIAETNIITILATAFLNMKTIISERNDPARQRLHQPWEIFRRWFYRFADVVTANSRGALTSLSDFVPREKLALVPNPLSAVPAAEEDRTRVILHVGRLHRQKAQDILLAAFAKVAAKFPEWRLAILGQGDLEATLRRQSQGLGIADRIDWLAPTPTPISHYSRAAIFALPSRYEGTPNALLEALNLGLPVIVSDASPGPLEVVVGEKSGLVVPADDVNALSTALERLMSSPELRERLGAQGRESVVRFQLAAVLPIWDAVLAR